MRILKVEYSLPILQKMADKGKWSIAKDWQILIFSDDGLIQLDVLRGFWTDLASVPKALRGVFDNGSSDIGILVSALFHDAIYATHLLSKELADEIFRKLLVYFRMSRFKARLYWLAVHLFGGDAWQFLSPETAKTDLKLIKLKWMDK